MYFIGINLLPHLELQVFWGVFFYQLSITTYKGLPVLFKLAPA